MKQENPEEGIQNIEAQMAAVPNLDEPVFPNGPTRAQVEQWKAMYGEIYATTFGDQVFIWRTLNRTEYKEILKIQNADSLYKEERMCEKCVLWPIGYNHIAISTSKAGIPSMIAEEIMAKSGFETTVGPVLL